MLLPILTICLYLIVDFILSCLYILHHTSLTKKKGELRIQRVASGDK